MSNKQSISSLTRITVGARGSPLSRVQVEEIQELIPEVYFQSTFISTTGDLDQKTSLRDLDKTDFFSKEIDERQLGGEFRISIHSAKDLPDSILEGLKVIAITKGVDSSDSLVLRQGDSLVEGMTIATSSERREEATRELCFNLNFVDIRGTIGQRIAKLDSGEIDGVVIAEAALIRLGLTHLNRITLPGETTPGQGQLAIIAKEGDEEVGELFSKIDTKSRTLYLGLEVPPSHIDCKWIHHPIITIVPREVKTIPDATHVIFTSKMAVEILMRAASPQWDTVIAVGKKTAERLQQFGVEVDIVAKNECAEGIVSELEKLDLKQAKLFWPHSSLSRPILTNYFEKNGIECEEVILYDTYAHNPGPLPEEYDEIFFTSPSTVRAFRELYGKFPAGKELVAIGPITKQELEAHK